MFDQQKKIVGRAGLYFGLKTGVLPLVGIALGMGLGGCGGGETVGEAMGYEQKGPDEMTVIKRPPLIVPPDFNLRPPRPGEQRSEANAASKAARETLIGQAAVPTPETNGEAAKVAIADEEQAPKTRSIADRTRETLISQDVDEQRYHKSPPLEPKDDQIAEVAADRSPSAGETALLSRTNRVERDIDALTETRSENRIDGALLRRLLAWQPTASTADAGAEEANTGKPSEQTVKLVRREQTPVENGVALE